jgi:hypothetical protein
MARRHGRTERSQLCCPYLRHVLARSLIDLQSSLSLGLKRRKPGLVDRDEPPSLAPRNAALPVPSTASVGSAALRHRLLQLILK